MKEIHTEIEINAPAEKVWLKRVIVAITVLSRSRSSLNISLMRRLQLHLRRLNLRSRQRVYRPNEE